jgi:hypothetical protein
VPRYHYRKNQASAESGPLSRPASFKDKQDGKKAPIRVTSFKSSFEEFNPFKVTGFGDFVALCSPHYFLWFIMYSNMLGVMPV